MRIEDIFSETDEVEKEETTPDTETETEIEKEEVGSTKEKEEIAEEQQVEKKETTVDPNLELTQLRQFIREQRKQIAAMESRLSRQESPKELDEEGKEKIVLSDLEKAQNELYQIAQVKSPVLEVLLETMSMTQKYADVYQVCTRANFDDIFEIAAGQLAKQTGRNFNELLVEVETDVWKKANPYKYMYEIIKAHHPRYAAAEEKKNENKTAKDVLKAKDAPSSIASMGGGEKGSATWTAAKIDELDEFELSKVPTDVYEKYMKGTLK